MCCAVRCAWSHSDSVRGTSEMRGCPALEWAKSLVLRYSACNHEHNYMQIRTGTERNGQVGRDYWQVTKRYDAHSMQHAAFFTLFAA